MRSLLDPSPVLLATVPVITVVRQANARSCTTSKAEDRQYRVPTWALFGLASIFGGYTTGRAARTLIRSSGSGGAGQRNSQNDGSRWPINAVQDRRLVALIA